MATEEKALDQLIRAAAQRDRDSSSAVRMLMDSPILEAERMAAENMIKLDKYSLKIASLEKQFFPLHTGKQ